MRYPIRVRDMQKLLSKSSAAIFLDAEMRPLVLVIREKYPWAFRQEEAGGRRKIQSYVAALAVLAATLGPKHVLLSEAPAASSESPSSPSDGEERKKGTDEVAPQSESPSEDSPFHGGDGASGEVEDGLSQGGEREHMSQAGGSAGNAGGGSRPEGVPSPSNPSPPDDAELNSDQAATETDRQVTSVGPDTSQAEEENGFCTDQQETEGQSRPESGAAMSAGRAVPKTTGGVGKRETGEIQALDGEMPAQADSAAGSRTGAANGPEGREGAQDEGRAQPPTSEHPDAGELALPSNPGDESEPDSSENKGRYRYRKLSGGGRQGSTAAKKSHGGVTAEMSQAGIGPALVKKARAALARLIDGGETQTGPRWNWTEFAVRLKTARPVYPARKEEDGRPAMLVLADVSGSCAGFSDVGLLVAQTVARLGMAGSDVIVVSHSNGHPVEWLINGDKPEMVDWSYDQDAQTWYAERLKRYDIQAVVALGDWDAEWLYHWLAELPSVRRLVWLDNWSCNVLPPTVRRDLFSRATKNDAPDFDSPWSFEEPWSPQARRKTTYVVGCQTADDFLTGLKLVLKGG